MAEERDTLGTLLPHQSLNEGAKTTILFIHGAFVTSEDWDLVIPHMRGYHLLLPDCPGHGRSSDLEFSIDNSAAHFSRLIEAKAVGRQAHIVGHSLGAKVAVRLAEKHPHVVRTLFVSGYEVYPGSSLTSALPYVLWSMNRGERVIPRPLVRWAMDGTDIGRGRPPPLSLCSQVARALSETTWPEPWPARSLIIAAGKGGIVPSYDHPEDSRKLAEIGKRRNADTFAYTHPHMRHPWNRQDPALWAATVMAWVEGLEMLDGFLPL